MLEKKKLENCRNRINPQTLVWPKFVIIEISTENKLYVTDITLRPALQVQRSKCVIKKKKSA